MTAGETALLDALRSTLRLRVRVLGEMVGSGHLSYADVLDDLVRGPVLAFCHDHPFAWDALELLEEELALDLADAAHAAESACYVPPVAGLPPYYAPITEPRAAALARQERVIWDTITEGARIGAARRDLAQRRDAEALHLDDPSPAARAALTRRLHREIAAAHGFDRWIPPAPRALLSGSQGSGKTRDAVRTVASLRERIAVRWTEPTLEKCDEVAAAYFDAARPHSLPHVVIRGRARQIPGKPPGTPMCRRHEVAELVAARGISVRGQLCPTCPFARGCGYLAQEAQVAAMKGVGLFITAAQGLFNPSPAPAADLFIGDERIDAGHVSQVPLASVASTALPYRGGTGLAAVTAAHRTIEAVGDALAQPHQLDALRTAGIDRAALQSAIALLDAEATPDASAITGSLSDAELRARLDALPERTALGCLKVLRAVAHELHQPRRVLNGVALDARGMLTLGRLQSVRGVPATSGVLLLDGTGNPDHARATWGARVRHEVVRIERDAHVTGTRGRSYSRQSITGLDARGLSMPNKEAAAARLRQDVATIAARLPGPCLVVAPMTAERALEDALPLDTPTAHFNALRGLNAHKNCPSVVVVGRTSMSVEQVEALARPYLANDPAPFASSATEPVPDDWPYVGWPYRATRMRRMRNGSLSAVEVEVHPDPRVQGVLEQVREAEAVQGVDRVRPIFNYRTIVAMNSLALDVTYDAILSHAELVDGGTRWDRAMAATGIVPLGARDLHAMHGDLFPSPSSAKDALKAAAISGGVAQRVSSLGTPPTYYYRRKGQTGSLSKALIDPHRHPDPWAALAAALGPLVWCERADPVQDCAPPLPVPPVDLPAPIQPRKPIVVWDRDGWPSPDHGEAAPIRPPAAHQATAPPLRPT